MRVRLSFFIERHYVVIHGIFGHLNLEPLDHRLLNIDALPVHPRAFPEAFVAKTILVEEILIVGEEHVLVLQPLLHFAVFLACLALFRIALLEAEAEQTRAD